MDCNEGTKTSTSVLEGHLAQQIAAAIERVAFRDIDSLAKQMWAAHGNGLLTDDEANTLYAALQRRRMTVSDLDQRRFSFDREGQELSGGYEATAAEQAAQLLAADRSRIRRRSTDMDAPKQEHLMDRNQVARILWVAITIEKKTYENRKPGDHHGALGDLAIDLLKVLMNFGRKHGQIFPSFATLEFLLRKCDDTIARALRRLIDQGFVTKHRRSKIVTTPAGKRRRQDSNAYEVHMPGENIGAARIPGLVSSDPKNSDVSGSNPGQITARSDRGADNDRFWLADPYVMPNGTVW